MGDVIHVQFIKYVSAKEFFFERKTIKTYFCKAMNYIKKSYIITFSQ